MFGQNELHFTPHISMTEHHRHFTKQYHQKVHLVSNLELSVIFFSRWGFANFVREPGMVKFTFLVPFKVLVFQVNLNMGFAN